MKSGSRKQRLTKKIYLDMLIHSAYEKQEEEGISDQEAIKYICDNASRYGIYTDNNDDYEKVKERYFYIKARLDERYARTHLRMRVYRMDSILDRANSKLDEIDKLMTELAEMQPQIQELESYYTSQDWKDDFATDENDEIPDNIKRGVLSEDGIYNMLERNKEIMDFMRED